MKRLNWQIIFLAVSLIVLSVTFYLIHYLIFRDINHIFLYLIGDIAFLPIQVLFVTFIIDNLLSSREKAAALKKMNMVIGAFFSEVGTGLIKYFSNFVTCSKEMKCELAGIVDWSEKEFSKFNKRVKNYDYDINSQRGDLEELKKFLTRKRTFLLRLLENPILLEHESFTSLLWAVFHLAEELNHRENIKQLPDTDYEHLSGDIKRVYSALISEWIDYMKHLKADYPYLFSLAVRTNPFDPHASSEVK